VPALVRIAVPLALLLAAASCVLQRMSERRRKKQPADAAPSA
jgi:hypothetical protein